MKYPDSYRYIAVLSYEDDGVHTTFPNLPGCVSYGTTEEEAVKNAKEVLTLHMWGIEEDGDEIPPASSMKELFSQEKLQSNETFFLVEAYMKSFREKQAKRFVKKTLSIPAWMNAEAELLHLNFSQELQNALSAKIKMAQA